MDTVREWIDRLAGIEFYHNTLLQWIISALVVIGLYFALTIARRIAVSRIRKFADRTKNDVDDLIVGLLESTRLWVILVVGLYVGLGFLSFPEQITTDLKSGESVSDPHMVDWARKIILVLTLTVQAMFWGNQLVNYGLTTFLKRRKDAEGETDAAVLASMGVAKFVVLIAVYALIILLALDNLGIEITPMLTTLGIGGIAVALAVQNVLSDLFASLSIVLDKPFVIGDFIIVGDKMGTVEKIGVKTTRLRALSGEQLIFANTDLLNSRVQNYKRMNERRVVFAVGVTYQTPLDKLKLIPEILTEAVNAQEKVRFDRCHFKSFGAFSLDFETVFYVLDREYAVYMNTQQAINLAIYERFAKEGIEFAYPTQTLFVEKPD